MSTLTLFGDYQPIASEYITSQERPFYPDYLVDAVQLYDKDMHLFRELSRASGSSEVLLRAIHEEKGNTRIQLLRMFRKYVSPMTSVEMLKVKQDLNRVIQTFGQDFRDIQLVRAHLELRPNPDEALAAVFWEHHDRGTPGYVLTANFFSRFETKYGDEYEILGPREAGRDVQLNEQFPKFHDIVPADFIIIRRADHQPLVVGFAHYDSDRGGSQEDDRTGGSQDKVEKIMSYAARRRTPIRVLFVNDGPGLLLGSMWQDYSRLETDNIVDDELRVMVLTLKMMDERLTKEWLNGQT